MFDPAFATGRPARWGMTLMAGLLLVSCRAPKLPPGPKPPEVVRPDPRGLTRHTLAHETRERHYLLYMPASLDLEQAHPVILAFHGEGQTPEEFMAMTGFNDLADEHGFMVAYPAGTGSNPRRLFWNILLSGTYATVNQVDDLGFVAGLLAAIRNQVPVDPAKIFATGFSQGGMLCYRLACDRELSGQLAAIAPVAATMTVMPGDCESARPVPVLSIHGRLDAYNNFHGGIGERAPRSDQMPRPGVAETIAFWVARGGLSDSPDTSGGRGTAQVRHFGPGADGYEVISWEIEDGGHTWPGGSGYLPEWMTGRINRDINAGSLIWQFFSRHAKGSL